MAPVKIKHIVSFTSQDPKYPVENLLLEEGLCPWLSCPRDRSRQLKVELQLEQASHIGYIDIGNGGSAFLQIDVGRSSWPLDQSFLTLLPTTTLMTPADAKMDKNRSGVRMFKEGDFLVSALGEKWDRVRLTCSQPFNKHAQFGLSFIRIRTPLDEDCSEAELASTHSQVHPASVGSQCLSSASFCRTFFPETPSSTEEEAMLKSRLQRLDPASSPGACGTTWMSRPARMVLKAACARKRPFPKAALPTSSAPETNEKGQAQPAAGSKQELPVRRSHMKASRRRRSHSCVERSIAASSTRPGDGFQRAINGHGRTRRLQKVEEEENMVVGTCPICAGHFPTSLLPVHASSCGEDSYEASPPSSSSSPSWEDSPEAWIHCPICQLPFPASEVEGHASSCGEQAEPLVGSSSWLQVE
ncbi:protein XNDC1N [Tiliqua scincoides]|uniref:protein XNDC1N n=1 Tax=Tiliqua scincoides TaxID=71010 RepID=UPI00346248CA